MQYFSCRTDEQGDSTSRKTRAIYALLVYVAKTNYALLTKISQKNLCTSPGKFLRVKFCRPESCDFLDLWWRAANLHFKSHLEVWLHVPSHLLEFQICSFTPVGNVVLPSLCLWMLSGGTSHLPKDAFNICIFSAGAPSLLEFRL